MDALKTRDANLADQLQRCVTSVVLNLAEGQRRQKGNRHRAYETAHGEAREVLRCLDRAQARGWTAEDARARATCEHLLRLYLGLSTNVVPRDRSSARTVDSADISACSG